MRNSSDLSPREVSSFVRSELAKSLRSRSPYTVNLLLGGYNPILSRPELYWIDYLASCAPVPYAAHGFEEGMGILRMCTDELKRRLPVDFKGVLVKVVDKDGIRVEDYVDEKPVYAP
ncbi:Proteasome subunit beta type-4 [Friedmanniomyces endolithicus]|nr:Proteasome subunit beta type-4 [Friedmanniomyces endolithicus]